MLTSLEAHYYWQNLYNITQSPELSPKQQLAAYDNIFFSVLNLLTEKREKQIFAGLFAKINFVCQVYDLGQAWEDKLQALRNLLRKNNTQVRFQPTEAQRFTALSILTELVFLTQNPQNRESIPEYIAQFLADKPIVNLVERHQPTQLLTNVWASILNKSHLKEHQGKKQITLTCQTENYGKVEITVNDIQVYAQGKLYKHFRLAENCLWYVIHQNLLFTEVECLEPTAWVTTDNTLIVLEPDYLIDASAIARCFLREGVTPYLYLLDKLTLFQGNEFTLEGNLMNEILDEWVKQPTIHFEEASKKALAKYSLVASKVQKEQLMTILERIKVQFENVKNALSEFQKHELITEPTFISPTHGLQGRLDILAKDKQNPKRKDIVELKSGNSFPQSKEANHNDLIQVACYNLLIENTFQERTGISAILYSKDNNRPLRNCGKLNFEQQEALQIRNRIVAIDFALARNPQKIFDKFLSLFNNLPDYKVREAKYIDQLWQQANELERAYFTAFFSLTMRERLIAKIGSVSNTDYAEGFANLWKRSLADKKETFSILHGLQVEKFDTEKFELRLRIPDFQISIFRENDIAILYPTPDPNEPAPTKQALLKATVKRLQKSEICLKLWSKHIEKTYFEQHATWAIEPLLLEKNYDNLLASLILFLQATQEKKELILGLQQPTFEPEIPPQLEQFLQALAQKLNAEQITILRKALSAQNYFLLQGPPGTGKTSQMLKNMVQYLFNHTTEIIVLLAFTNRATDEICEKLKAVCPHEFIRFGTSDEGETFGEKILREEKTLMAISEKLKRTRVFVSTVSSFLANMQFIPQFDTLIVDEASQLTEPYLCGILPKFKRFILIGDEKQLPAVITQPPEFCKTDNPQLAQIFLSDLSISIFERLLLNAQAKNWHECYAMLSTQFRTHQDIAGFISKEFYKTLKVGSPQQQAPWTWFNPLSTDNIERNLAQSRMIFIPTQKEKQSKLHKQEAQIVAKLVSTIRKARGELFNENTIGIITPYKAQIAEITKQLAPDLQELVTVDTVERYQGSEREIIIISMALNHELQLRNLQMLNYDGSVDRKLNVALSRAREQLILLGNPEILQKATFYQKLLQYIPYHWKWKESESE
ncbi:MAG: AAA domain-containing protein [Microscillaceae bacterium]|nr:AAA domain-containing protein [Microscillaceae bacterium]MDW8461950.1 AAA domain-containing protein [Cytophagales bacterium]